MTPPRHSQRVTTDVAEVFARAYLRLTQKSRTSAVSGSEEPQKPLDVLAAESPHVVAEIGHGRSR